MRQVNVEAITDTIQALCIQACCVLPPDVEAALNAALSKEEPGTPAFATLGQIIENARLAREGMRPICQDTGVAVVFVELGREVHLSGDLYAAINEGVRRAYVGGYLRKSVLGALSRENTGDNTPAVVHLTLVEGDAIRLTVAPKGFGSENMSRVAMLSPDMGTAGILDTIVDTVLQAGACACPPVVVGVGIGGTMEVAAQLAKRQLLRPLGQPGSASVAELEQEALARINRLGSGPMGLGGNTTALAVHIGELPTHIAGLPVAVNLQCHACRHAQGVV